MLDESGFLSQDLITSLGHPGDDLGSVDLPVHLREGFGSEQQPNPTARFLQLPFHFTIHALHRL